MPPIRLSRAMLGCVRRRLTPTDTARHLARVPRQTSAVRPWDHNHCVHSAHYYLSDPGSILCTTICQTPGAAPCVFAVHSGQLQSQTGTLVTGDDAPQPMLWLYELSAVHDSLAPSAGIVRPPAYIPLPRALAAHAPSSRWTAIRTLVVTLPAVSAVAPSTLR